MEITIKDVAKKAGVSVTTVSRVLNNKPDVSNSTKEKILKIINDLNYKPNSVARGLVMQKTNTIGLIIPDISNPFFPEIAKAIEDKAQKLGYSVILFNTDNHLEREREGIKVLNSKQVDGLIVSLSLDNKDILKELKERNYPVVQIDRSVLEHHYPLVSINNKKSAFEMVEYMINKGHSKIAHITGDLHTTTAKDRLQGYKEALKEYGIHFNNEFIIEGDYSQNSGYKGTEKLLSLRNKPTAIFAANDLMAAGVYQSLIEKNLKIPEDIAVGGHDDIALASLLTPALTTMKQPEYQLGQKALMILLKMINSKKIIDIEDQILETEIIIRDSI